MPAPVSEPPRVWLEHPNQQMSNVGDLAMLMMDVERTRVLYPEAVIQVPSRATEWIRQFCPAAIRITASGLYHLAWRGLLPERLARIPSFYAVERRLILANTWRYLRLVDWRNRVRGQRDPHSALELAALARSRAVIACGGGYLNDAFAGAASRCSKVLLAAQSRGIPTALMGQGLGPVENETTRELVLAALKRSRFVGLREGRGGPVLTEAAGVPSERMRVTGDGAIDLAARERRDALGDCIGFNVRVASYAQTESSGFGRLAEIVCAEARARQATVVPCPIHFGHTAPDEPIARTLLGDRATVVPDPCPFDPMEVIRRVGRCRVVVTGSYHAAVFALAQGIPAITLVGSRYYDFKFRGLADLFGDAIEVIALDDADAGERLQAALPRFWLAAESLRAPCLEAADRQRDWTREAWTQLRERLRQRL